MPWPCPQAQAITKNKNDNYNLINPVHYFLAKIAKDSNIHAIFKGTSRHFPLTSPAGELYFIVCRKSVHRV
jgi:hypothetical protein